MKDLIYATAFISSTFADMKGERNLMMYNVLPRVKQWALARGIIFDTVDLRWGINENQANDLHHTIKICLERVKECDPLFICFVGERYGWIPEKPDFNQDMFESDISKYIGLSTTELEIIQAIYGAFFEDPTDKTRIFLFRDNLCFDGVDKSIREIYREEEYILNLDRLKRKIEESNCVIKYSAKFEMEDETVALGHFQAHGRALEDVLTERIIDTLRKKYLIDDEAVIYDDYLLHQQFHLKQLALVPKIDHCVSSMHNLIEDAPEYHLRLLTLNHKHSLEHQVAHLIVEESKNYNVIYRFMGIDRSVADAGDLIKSLAYEISGDVECLYDFIRSSRFLRDWFDKSNEKTMLVVAGISEENLNDYVNLLREFVNFWQVSDRECIKYSKSDFLLLAQNMLNIKAKTLIPEHLEAIVHFSDEDFRLLKTTVNYLCTFASYETLAEMISELNC